MASQETLKDIYLKYKDFTKAVLVEIFDSPEGANRTCRAIEKRVKQLKAKGRVFPLSFFNKLRQAISGRRKAAKHYSELFEN